MTEMDELSHYILQLSLRCVTTVSEIETDTETGTETETERMKGPDKLSQHILQLRFALRHDGLRYRHRALTQTKG